MPQVMSSAMEASEPAGVRHCGLVLLPGFSPLAAGAIGQWLSLLSGPPLRPELSDAAVYRIRSLSLGTPPAVWLDEPLRRCHDLDELVAQPWFALIVLSGADVVVDDKLLHALQRQGVGAQYLLGVDGGAVALAEAGFLRGHRATVSWPLLDSLRQDFPEVVWTDRLWEGESTVWTCAGGLAVLEMLAAWLEQLHGEAVRPALLDSLGLGSWRDRDSRQQRPQSSAASGSSPKLGEALALMEANLGEPLPTEDIARLVGVSRRQLERLFKQHLGALPSRYYAELRLQRARRLLQQSSQSILQIGLSCGFASGSHFSNAYKAFFGHTPRDERSQRQSLSRRNGQALARPGEDT